MAGYDVVLVAPHVRCETRDGVRIIALPQARSRLQRISGSTFRVLAKGLKQKANVYHFHDPELIPACLFLKLLGKRVIYDVHEDYAKSILCKRWLPAMVRNPISRLFNLFEKIVFRLFDCVVAATPHIASTFGCPGIVHIANYPIATLIEKHSTRKPVLCGRHCTLVYAGVMAPAYGIANLVEAFKLINSRYNAQLVLMGNFEDKYFETEIRSAASTAGAEVLGSLPLESAYERVASADIGMACCLPGPNDIESLPTKIFEYMGLGLPIVGSDFPLWVKVIRGNDCGLTVNPLVPRQIAQAVEYLMDNPVEARKMGENGRRIVRDRYNWETESKKLLEMYSEILKGRAKDRLYSPIPPD